MTDILLSIIVPVYNQEKYLAKCLDSILENHMGASCEVILIDDGSTDSSGAIIDSYAMKNECFVVRHTNNQGVAVARNLGLDLARGHYIAWIDPDDYISSDWYEKICMELKRGYDLIFFDMSVVCGERHDVRYYANRSFDVSVSDFIWQLQGDTRIQSHLWSKIFARELWESIQFPIHLSYCEDYSVLHKVAVRAKKIRYLHEALYYYVQHGASIVHDESRPLEHCVIEMKLSKQRYTFLQERAFRLNPAGVWMARIQFLWQYSSATKELQKEYKEDYLLAVREVRRSLISILFSLKLSLRWKMKAIISLLK